MNKKGFTMIELLVVIALLGILTAIAVPIIIGISSDVNIRFTSRQGFTGTIINCTTTPASCPR